jgi:hypothetical protein
VAQILIKPISVKTQEGWSVTIDSLYIISTDFLSGIVDFNNGQRETVSWDQYGRARNRDDGYNLERNNSELDEAIETALLLRKNINSR